MQKFSYHTHTNFSDGKFSLEAMLEKAVDLGWKEIGVSDHMIIHKDIKKTPRYKVLVANTGNNIYRDSFEKSLIDFQKHSEYIRKVSKRYPIKVFIGYEVDYFTYNGWEEEFKEFIKQIDHDYLLNGNHFFFDEKCELIVDICRYDGLFENKDISIYEEYLRRHYCTVKKAVESGLFDILAHLDYARRSSLHVNFECKNERLDIIKSLKNTNTAIELSTKGLRKIGDFYPEEFLIKEVIKNKIPIVINDDAHNIDELGFEFCKAEEKLKDLNCVNRFHLK